MTEKIFNVTDLGPGDGGKGGVVHKITTLVHRVGKFLRRVHTVIKGGGGQGSHGTATSRGESFAFSHWGCGTFEGIPTHITSRMVIIPEGILNEADALRYGHGVHDPFSLLTIDKEALCSTPLHRIASHLKELARGNDSRGTIGTGVGEAYRYHQLHPELSIRAADLDRPDLQDILAALRQQICQDLDVIIRGDFLPEDVSNAEKEIELLKDDGLLEYIVGRFKALSRQARIVDHGYIAREILSRDGVAVVENSHGVLTDNFYGFHPHTSAIRTLPRFTHDMFMEAGYVGQIIDIGVHRAYEIRHGAGPMPTADHKMGESLLPGSHKMENRYQGKLRVGPLDLMLMRYAIDVCGGPQAFDALAITWFDQVSRNGAWHICDQYKETDNRTFFSPAGRIKIHDGKGREHFQYQEKLGTLIANCHPEISVINIKPAATKDDLYWLCAEILQEKLNIPVRMISFGPTELDKICK